MQGRLKRESGRNRNETGENSEKTNETNISLALEIDGEGKADIQTDVPFMTHMLDLFTKHGHFNLTVDAKGIRMLMITTQQKISALYLGKCLRKR